MAVFYVDKQKDLSDQKPLCFLGEEQKSWAQGTVIETDENITPFQFQCPKHKGCADKLERFREVSLKTIMGWKSGS